MIIYDLRGGIVFYLFEPFATIRLSLLSLILAASAMMVGYRVYQHLIPSARRGWAVFFGLFVTMLVLGQALAGLFFWIFFLIPVAVGGGMLLNASRPSVGQL